MTQINQTFKEWKLIGDVTHYFDKANVAAIKLKDSLTQGDIVRITGGIDTDFEQTVESIEIDHKKVKKAKKGQEIGLKVKSKARQGYKVYRSK